MTDVSMSHTDRRRQIEALIERLRETDGALQALAAGELDAVVDPASAAPMLLSRAQKALAESEARHRELVRRCPALVCEIDVDGRTLFVNEAVRTLLGVDPEDLVGKSWWDSVIAPEYLGDARRLASQVRHGDVTNFELPLADSRGQLRWVLWTTANRYSETGELELVIAFGIDITEQKHAEETSRELLDAHVARARAEASNKAKMDFLAVMSHELRTPLNSIGGYVELMELGLRGPITSEQREDLWRIRRSQRHLLGLINDLMNYAKLETGHVDLEFENVSVNEVLAVLDALTEPQVLAKQLTYERNRCDPSLTIWADREKTHQILINLVSNSVKFTKSGGRITVNCVPFDDHVAFRVLDTGEGIPAESLYSIFEPFVQVKSGYAREHDGVGLGLAISRDLARMMRGDLTVESTVGAGSCFTLTLPRTA